MEEENKKVPLTLKELLSRAEAADNSKKFAISTNYYFLILSRHSGSLKKDQFEQIVKKFIFGIILLTDSSQKQRMINYAVENDTLRVFEFKSFFEKILNYELIFNDDFVKISSNCPASHKDNNFDKSFFEHNIISLSKVFENISFSSAEKFLRMKIDAILDYLVKMNTEGKINAIIDENSKYILFQQEEENFTDFDKQIQQFCLDVKKLGEYIKSKQ